MSAEIDSLPLIRTKLYQPRVTGDLVPRPRLLQRLEQRRGRPLTLVVAPAGFGKTTLVSSWLEACDCPSAWLSLDEDDDDLALFLTYLLAAMQNYVQRRKKAGITFTTHSTSVDYIEGLTAYLSGERETGISLVARAVEDGKYLWTTQTYLQDLYDDPGFAPIMAKQRARQVREREKFLVVVCDDNPYAAVWQPEAGTCERFLAESESR